MIKIIHSSTSNTEFDNQVRISNYYDKGWTNIVRPLSKANKLVSVALEIANNENVGYSLDKRHTLYDALSKGGIEGKVYCDCSSFVATCIAESGIYSYIKGLTTKTMLDLLPRNKFEILPFEKDKLINGDIILKVGSHCGICYDELYAKQRSKIGKGIVKCKSLIVRDAPYGEWIKSVFKGDVVKIIDEQKGWYHIKYKDIDGWCSTIYINKICETI